MAGRLLTWSIAANAPVTLAPTGMGGGEVEIYARESDPDSLAAVPLSGTDAGAFFAKAAALREVLPNWKSASVPTEILVHPRDKKTPVAVGMDRKPGRLLEELFFPAERRALGIDWGPTELALGARKHAALFVTSEHFGVTQNDCHAGNYTLETDYSGNPLNAYRLDTAAFGFWHKGRYFGCDKTRWEYVPPELQWLGKRPEGLKGFEMPREADRYALAALVFAWLTGANPWEYAGGDPDPVKRVEKKAFAVLSTPAGAKVPDEVETAYYGLPAPVAAALERGLLGDPKNRPSPSEWVRLLKGVGRPRRTWFLPSLRVGLPVRRWGRLAAVAVRPHVAAVAGTAALAGAVWLLPSGGPAPDPDPGPPPVAQPTTEPAAVQPAADRPGNTVPPRTQPRADRPLATAADPPIPPPPRRPDDPNAFHQLNR